MMKRNGERIRCPAPALSALVVALILAAALAACDQPGGKIPVQEEETPKDQDGPVNKSLSSAADLAKIGVDDEWPLNGLYTLTSDITLTGWTPVGSFEEPFSGEFDGGDKTITIESLQAAAGPYTGLFGYVKGGTIRRVKLAGTITVNHDSSEAKALFAGGIAGYLADSTLEDVNSTVVIDAASVQGPVYAGGLAGYGKNLTMSRCTAAGAVSARGQGHNSSAGGLGGYLLQSTVKDCSASGAVLLEALPLTADKQDYLFMVYGGGLLGYTGDGTLTQGCYAEGTVTSRSPYPYAGGLVGYNYGDLSGETEGSTIRESWAAGAVAAEAAKNGIAYAGGLAGYTSQKGKLEDCWASGTVRAQSGGQYAWAGGITGSCANSGQVRRCYARGAVTAITGTGELPFEGQPGITPGALAGGIAGYVYWNTDALVENCAALNASVSAQSVSAQAEGEGEAAPYGVHRVIGRIDEHAQKRNNIARVETCEPPPEPDMGPDGLDGADAAVPLTAEVFTALGWDLSAVWEMGADGYPVLR
jgi:hypothetical protein